MQIHSDIAREIDRLIDLADRRWEEHQADVSSSDETRDTLHAARVADLAARAVYAAGQHGWLHARRDVLGRSIYDELRADAQVLVDEAERNVD